MNYIYDENYQAYNGLIEEILKGIEKAHPNLDEETKRKYVRVALNMMKKNKIEMKIHSPRKSTDRWYRALRNLKESSQLNEDKEEKIIQIETLRKK